MRRLTAPRQAARSSARNPTTARAAATTPAAISQEPASRSSPIAVASAVSGPLGSAPAGSTGWNGEPGAAAKIAHDEEPHDRERDRPGRTPRGRIEG